MFLKNQIFVDKRLNNTNTFFEDPITCQDCLSNKSTTIIRDHGLPNYGICLIHFMYGLYRVESQLYIHNKITKLLQTLTELRHVQH